HALYHAGVTAGCSVTPPLYCPADTVTRKQMAKFLLVAKNGSMFQPPPPTGVFADVPIGDVFAAFIERLASDGVTKGCRLTPALYCPDQVVTRAQMAVFLLKSKFGAAYSPPPPVGRFTDVPVNDPFAAYIEALANLQITGGCGLNLYCPNSPVTRSQMAVF